MSGVFGSLSDWVLGFAESAWAPLVLAATAFTESIFFPIPPDLLLIGIGVLHPEKGLWLAAVATAASVAGAVVGHWLGRRLGRPALSRLVDQRRVDFAERLFGKYGSWAVLVAALTPVPYKVFAILAGVLDLDLRRFVVASLVGRGIRFFFLGSLIFVFGEPIEGFIDANFGLLTVAVAAVLIAGAAVALVVMRLRNRRDTGEADTPPGASPQHDG